MMGNRATKLEKLRRGRLSVPTEEPSEKEEEGISTAIEITNAHEVSKKMQGYRSVLICDDLNRKRQIRKSLDDAGLTPIAFSTTSVVMDELRTNKFSCQLIIIDTPTHPDTVDKVCKTLRTRKLETKIVVLTDLSMADEDQEKREKRWLELKKLGVDKIFNHPILPDLLRTYLIETVPKIDI